MRNNLGVDDEEYDDFEQGDDFKGTSRGLPIAVPVALEFPEPSAPPLVTSATAYQILSLNPLMLISDLEEDPYSLIIARAEFSMEQTADEHELSEEEEFEEESETASSESGSKKSRYSIVSVKYEKVCTDSVVPLYTQEHLMLRELSSMFSATPIAVGVIGELELLETTDICADDPHRQLSIVKLVQEVGGASLRDVIELFGAMTKPSDVFNLGFSLMRILSLMESRGVSHNGIDAKSILVRSSDFTDLRLVNWGLGRLGQEAEEIMETDGSEASETTIEQSDLLIDRRSVCETLLYATSGKVSEIGKTSKNCFAKSLYDSLSSKTKQVAKRFSLGLMSIDQESSVYPFDRMVKDLLHVLGESGGREVSDKAMARIFKNRIEETKTLDLLNFYATDRLVVLGKHFHQPMPGKGNQSVEMLNKFEYMESRENEVFVFGGVGGAEEENEQVDDLFAEEAVDAAAVPTASKQYLLVYQSLCAGGCVNDLQTQWSLAHLAADFGGEARFLRPHHWLPADGYQPGIAFETAPDVIPLDQGILGEPTVGAFEVFIEIMKNLQILHSRKIIYNNVNPKGILISRKSSTAILFDYKNAETEFGNPSRSMSNFDFVSTVSWTNVVEAIDKFPGNQQKYGVSIFNDLFQAIETTIELMMGGANSKYRQMMHDLIYGEYFVFSSSLKAPNGQPDILPLPAMFDSNDPLLVYGRIKSEMSDYVRYFLRSEDKLNWEDDLPGKAVVEQKLLNELFEKLEQDFNGWSTRVKQNAATEPTVNYNEYLEIANKYLNYVGKKKEFRDPKIRAKFLLQAVWEEITIRGPKLMPQETLNALPLMLHRRMSDARIMHEVIPGRLVKRLKSFRFEISEPLYKNQDSIYFLSLLETERNAPSPYVIQFSFTNGNAAAAGPIDREININLEKNTARRNYLFHYLAYHLGGDETGNKLTPRPIYISPLFDTPPIRHEHFKRGVWDADEHEYSVIYSIRERIGYSLWRYYNKMDWYERRAAGGPRPNTSILPTLLMNLFEYSVGMLKRLHDLGIVHNGLDISSICWSQFVPGDFDDLTFDQLVEIANTQKLVLYEFGVSRFVPQDSDEIFNNDLNQPNFYNNPRNYENLSFWQIANNQNYRPTYRDDLVRLIEIFANIWAGNNYPDFQIPNDHQPPQAVELHHTLLEFKGTARFFNYIPQNLFIANSDVIRPVIVDTLNRMALSITSKSSREEQPDYHLVIKVIQFVKNCLTDHINCNNIPHIPTTNA